MKNLLLTIFVLLAALALAFSQDFRRGVFKCPSKELGRLEMYTYHPQWQMGPWPTRFQVDSIPFDKMPGLTDIIHFPGTGAMDTSAEPYYANCGQFGDSCLERNDSLDYFYNGIGYPQDAKITTWRLRGDLDTLIDRAHKAAVKVIASSGNNGWSMHKLMDSCQVAFSAFDGGYVTSVSYDARMWFKSCSVYVSASSTAPELMVYRNFSTAVNGFTAANIDSPFNAWQVWLKPSISLNEGDIALVYDENSACLSPVDTIDVPALEANVWTEVALYFTDTSKVNRDYVISCGLMQKVYRGGYTLKIDDLRCSDRRSDNAVYWVMSDSVRSHIFAKGVWEFVERNDFDGFETDYEGTGMKPDSACINRFYKLLAQERDAAEARQGRQYKLLITCGQTWAARYPYMTQHTYADRMVLMCYTNSPFWWSKSATPPNPDTLRDGSPGSYNSDLSVVGFLGAIYKGEMPAGIDHSVYKAGDWDLFNWHVLSDNGWGPNAFISRGTPANHLVLIAPAYSHTSNRCDSLWKGFWAYARETPRWRIDWAVTYFGATKTYDHVRGKAQVIGLADESINDFGWNSKFYCENGYWFRIDASQDSLFLQYAAYADTLGLAGVGLYDMSNDIYFSASNREYLLFHEQMSAIILKDGWEY